MIRAWGIDISYYQGTVNWRALKDAGMTFAIIKSSMRNGIDSKCQAHATGAHSAGIPLIGLYHWSDPTGTVDQEGAHFTTAKNLAPSCHFAAADNEQWWENWTQYYDALEGRIPWSQVTRIAPNTIATFDQQMTQRVKDISGLYTLNYTSRWFIQDYAPGMTAWVNQFPLWVADWVTWGMPVVKLDTWQQFYQVIDNLTNPRLPVSANTWDIWQFTDAKFKMPGMPGYDVDVFNGTPAEMIQRIGQVIVPPPPPPPPPPPGSYTAYITASVLIVRNAPNGSMLSWTTWYIDFNKTMKPITILEERDGWGRTDRGWVSLNYVVRA
jgi:GH25 family lysozyme M1 (1,4-beta-N-acetylmuramidase)